MLRITLLLVLAISVFGFAPNAHVSMRQSVSAPATLRMAEEDNTEEVPSMVSSSFEESAEKKDQKWVDTESGAVEPNSVFNFSTLFVIFPGEFVFGFVFVFVIVFVSVIQYT